MPTHETPRDRAKERAIADRYAWIAKCGLLEMPHKSVIDYVFYRGDEAKSIIEVRTRGCRHRQYADYMLSVKKWDAVLAMSEWLQLPAYFLVQFAGSDALYLMAAAGEPYKFTADTGRKDRGDPFDVGPAGHFQWDRLKRVRAA